MIEDEVNAGGPQRLEDLSPTQLDQLLQVLTAAAPKAVERILPHARGVAPLPLSFAQERLWFLDQLHPGSPAYNIPAAFRLRGPLSSSLLERSLTEVVRRHEALRTTFPALASGPVQLVAATGDVRLLAVDLESLPPRARLAASERAIGAE